MAGNVSRLGIKFYSVGRFQTKKISHMKSRHAHMGNLCLLQGESRFFHLCKRLEFANMGEVE